VRRKTVAILASRYAFFRPSARFLTGDSHGHEAFRSPLMQNPGMYIATALHHKLPEAVT